MTKFVLMDWKTTCSDCGQLLRQGEPFYRPEAYIDFGAWLLIQLCQACAIVREMSHDQSPRT